MNAPYAADDSVVPAVILYGSDIVVSGFSHECFHCFRLVISDLEEQHAACHKSAHCFRNDPSVKTETVISAVQCHSRFMDTHFGRELFYNSAPYIRRIGDDDIKSLIRSDRLEQIAAAKFCPVGKAQSLRVARRNCDRFFGEVGSHSCGAV